MKILLVLSLLMTAMFSTSAFAKKRKCYANFSWDKKSFTGEKYLGKVRGVSKKKKCAKLAKKKGPAYAKKLKLPKVTATHCKKGLTIYGDTRVQGKRKSRDGNFALKATCKYKNGSCKKWVNTSTFESGSW